MDKENADAQYSVSLRVVSYYLFFKRNRKFLFWLLMYSLFFVIGQYISVFSVDLSWLLGQGWWIPLHVITVIPLVDICRSFAQHYAEQTGVTFLNIFISIALFSFLMSLIFTITAGLPLNICLAAILSVNVGGVVGIAIFHWASQISHKPYVRMLFSNLGATTVGGAVFFSIAYTNALSYALAWFGYQFVNTHLMEDLLKGWIIQSLFIWGAGVPLAVFINYIIDYCEKR